MADLIDRATLIKQINLSQSRTSLGEVCTRDINGLEICGLIKDAPAVDAVEVIRCIDCRYACLVTDHDLQCLYDDDSILRPHSGYCSFAKRRTDATD